MVAKLGNIVGEHVKFDMFAKNVGQFGYTSIAIALIGDQSNLSLELSTSHSHLVAVVALRVDFNSTFERSLKTSRVAANHSRAL